MKITRSRETSDFTVTPNTLYRDTRLSYRALGVLLYLLHLPDGYEIDSADLSRDRSEGRDAIRTALTEIENAGYLTRERRQDPATGRWNTHTSVSSHPQTPQVAPTTENQASDNQAPDTNPQVTPETDFQSSDTRTSGTRTSVCQALKPSTDTKDTPTGHPPAPRTDRARNQAEALNQTATNANTLQLVRQWQQDRGHDYTRSQTNNLAQALDQLTHDGANPQHYPATLDIYHRDGHSIGFIPHAYEQAMKDRASVAAGTPARPPQQRATGREAKAQGWLALGQQPEPHSPTEGSLLVIDGVRSA